MTTPRPLRRPRERCDAPETAVMPHHLLASSMSLSVIPLHRLLMLTVRQKNDIHSHNNRSPEVNLSEVLKL